MMHILSEGRVELVPAASTKDPFTIPAKESRDFTVSMPRLASYYALLEQGGANLHLPIRPTDTTEVVLASTMFQRAALQRYIVPADLADAPPKP